MTYQAVSSEAARHGLLVYGGFHPNETDGLPPGTGTLLMLGPAPRYWSIFTQSLEWRSKIPDPVDLWSTRTLSELAQLLDATAHLPFGGPPYAPFLNWALKTGRCWSSPVGMLVHDTTGLFVSFRGALSFRDHLDLPARPSVSPCDTCADKPCTTACPVAALGPAGYDTDACHGHLATPAGQDCLKAGCLARRACPVSARAGRIAAQSAHHMSYFHKSPPAL